MRVLIIRFVEVFHFTGELLRAFKANTTQLSESVPRILYSKFLIPAAFFVLVLGSAWLLRTNRSTQGLVINGPSFHLHYCTVTRGTNHIVVSGNKKLARLNLNIDKLNNKLNTRIIPRISNAQINWITSKEDATLVSIGFCTDPMPTEWVLAATMVSPEGSLIPLNPAVSADFYDDYGRFYEWLYSWEMPAQLTNFANYELRFSKIKDGKRVATLKLE